MAYIDGYQRRLILHESFNDDRAEWEHYWTLQVLRPGLFCRGMKWKTEKYWTEVGGITKRWYDLKIVKNLAKHYRIEVPMPERSKV